MGAYFQHIVERAATAITSAAITAYLMIGRQSPKSMAMQLTLVNASSVTGYPVYSANGTTIAARGALITVPDGANNVIIPVDTAYPYVAFDWVGGTADSLTMSLHENILGS